MASRSVFQLIDLDRTLFNTSLFVKLICNAVDEYQPGLGNEIDKRFEEAYKKEESFFVLEYIRQTLGESQYSTFVEHAIRRIDQDALLLPGVKERLSLAEILSGDTLGYGILTYSLYSQDQLLKVKLAGLEHIAMHVVDTPDKAELVATWRTDDGKFQLPEVFGGHIVNELTLEDDKLRAFVNLPENVTGFWVTSHDNALEQVNALGLSNVRPVRHLDESARILRTEFLSE